MAKWFLLRYMKLNTWSKNPTHLMGAGTNPTELNGHSFGARLGVML